MATNDDWVPTDWPAGSGAGSKPNSASPGQQAAVAAAAAVPGIIARLSSDGNSNVPPELRQLLAQQVARSQYQNPLFQAVTNQAFQGLPTYARDGLSLGSLGSPTLGPDGNDSGPNFFATPGGSAFTSLIAQAASPWVRQALRHLLSGGPTGATDANTFVGPRLPGGSNDNPILGGGGTPPPPLGQFTGYDEYGFPKYPYQFPNSPAQDYPNTDGRGGVGGASGRRGPYGK